MHAALVLLRGASALQLGLAAAGEDKGLGVLLAPLRQVRAAAAGQGVITRGPGCSCVPAPLGMLQTAASLLLSSPPKPTWSSLSAARVLAPPMSPLPPPPFFFPSAALRFSALRPDFFLRCDLPPSAMAAGPLASRRCVWLAPLSQLLPYWKLIRIGRCRLCAVVASRTAVRQGSGSGGGGGGGEHGCAMPVRWLRHMLSRHDTLPSRLGGWQARSGASGSSALVGPGSCGAVPVAVESQRQLQAVELPRGRFPHCMHAACARLAAAHRGGPHRACMPLITETAQINLLQVCLPLRLARPTRRPACSRALWRACKCPALRTLR